MLQLFRDYKNNPLIDADLMKYSITKALVVYRPQEIIKCLYESPESFLEELRRFFCDRIEHNKGTPELKQQETNAFQQILSILHNISDTLEVAWDYHMPFDGFKKYLLERGISNYSLIIDKEGEESKTLKAAHEIGLGNSVEADSTKCPGLRIADMIAGIISKLLKGLCDSLRYHSLDECTNKKILDTEWFRLSEVQLELYKKLYQLICVWQPAWYKSYSGIYSDDLVTFNALLNFMNHFESVDQLRANLDMQGEYFNAFACSQLARYFDRRRRKLSIEPIIRFNEEIYLNQSGRDVFFDSRKRPLLPLHEGSQTFDVLSVEMDQKFTPSVIILRAGETECFRLPNELSGWASSVVEMAAMGMNLLPTKVTFSKINGRYAVREYRF